MSEFNSLPYKPAPERNDRLVGTDTSSGALAYFSLHDLAAFFTRDAADDTHPQATWSPGTIANLAGATTPVAVSGAAFGDVAIAGWSVALPVGVALLANVSAPGVVTVTLINLSGASQTIAAGVATVVIL